MAKFRRFYTPGAIIFITCVTLERRPYLSGTENLGIFWDTLHAVQAIYTFHLLAYVILPDHFHWLMMLPDTKENFSPILQSVKWNFTRNFKRHYCIRRTAKLWQNRFWDHIIRSETDLERHVDYIHWNPVKHGYVETPDQWEQSSFRHWIERGYYGEGWGRLSEPESLRGMSEE